MKPIIKKLTKNPNIEIESLGVKKLNDHTFHVQIQLSNRYFELTHGGDPDGDLIIISASEDDKYDWEINFQESELYFFESRSKYEVSFLVIKGRKNFENIHKDMEIIA